MSIPSPVTPENATPAPAAQSPSDSQRRRLISILTHNWQDEKESAATYRTLAEREMERQSAHLLFAMAEAEEKHAYRWQERLRELGAPQPVYRGKLTGTADSLANRLSGTEGAYRRIELRERQHTSDYGRQLKEVGDVASIAILHDIIKDEQAHARALRRLYRPARDSRALDPQAALDRLLAKRDKGRRRASSWIGDAIYGVNDGLGAIFGIVSGVSGATINNAHGSRVVLLAGIAGMIASALSMGSGAYLAAKSEREIYEAEMHHEREALQDNPDEAHQMLSLYYQIKGVPVDDADRVVEHLSADEGNFLRAIAAERLNGTEDALSNPWVSALSGSVSTAIGAFVPIIPFFFLSGYPAVIVAAVISLIAHFAVGAAKSMITVRSWWASGLEMTFVGAIEGLVTYGIGLMLGGVGA
jgi:VIT1/CCC1 family predicted Fe2+/Mn2+ transporter/rubrerythrin